jgi:hypothetical protein
VAGVIRDYVRWHDEYDDPTSSLPWRLGVVRDWISDYLDRHPGDVRIVSACAGDGRDVIGVVGERPDSARVQASLVELHPEIAARAAASARAAGLGGVRIVQADAGEARTYADLVPADLVLLVGVFGNITDDDLARTIAAVPQLCAPGAEVIWSRGRAADGSNEAIRQAFRDAGCEEVAYVTYEGAPLPGLGRVRFAGTPRPLDTSRRWFTFVR